MSKRQIALSCSIVLTLAISLAAAAAVPGTAEPLAALERACERRDQREMVRLIGDLKTRWGAAPDYARIGEAALATGADPQFRWIMIDSLIRYQRTVEDRRSADHLLGLLDAVSWAEDDSLFVRAKAVTVQAGMIALFWEKGLISEERRSEFGKKLAGLLKQEKDSELLAAAVIAAGRAGDPAAIPVLRKILRNQKLSSLARRTAAGSLGRLNDRESITLLAEVLEKTADRALFGASAFALGAMGGEEVIAPLADFAGRFDTNSCRNALRRNSAAIKGALKDVNSPRLESAIRAAGLAGGQEFLPELQSLGNDARPEMRRAAREALIELPGDTSGEVEQ